VISSTCEYIILSAFGIVVVASIAAFVMGLTRFIKCNRVAACVSRADFL